MKRAVGLTLILAACVPGEGPSMRPFEDCLGCHDGSRSARRWTVAGTWAKGAHVAVVDANGRSLTLRGNEVGNFYTAEPLAFPLTVSVNGQPMPQPLTYGGCNVCHRADALTVGPLMAPGVDCLGCHGPGGMAAAKFTAAGTWGGAAGQVVTLAGHYQAQTNAVGNFAFCASGPACTWNGVSYGTPAPITISSASPTTVTVGGGEGMTNLVYGGCNRCHGLGGSAGGGD